MIFSTAEVGALVRAVGKAPSVHNTQPWTVDVRTDVADLYERPVSLPRHDPGGRDRLLSCGAALTNLELAIRALGWDTETVLLPEDARPDLLASVRTRGGRAATGEEVGKYATIFQRRSHRAPFGLRAVRPGLLRALVASTDVPGVRTRVVDARTEASAVADLLGYAAAVYRDDRAYQRELAAWSSGFPHPPSADSTLPWAGLVRRDTRLPDEITLADRISRERLLILTTGGDDRRDQLVAGVAMQHLWLAAVGAGLVASVLTQPLHLSEVRAGLAERLGLEGHPQLILRAGYPTHPDRTSSPLPAATARPHR
ncbi:Acg family FMN-binding oxidoreductase [Amycolatopsis cihanbeyliensis]|uniref:Nitroreductase domain-containing protein n=1 Tax=Amycolatopsis cihanbeyliensis TaxID=1128664 RepID=A0A542DDY9_AMYCI|nr:nitroreductase family protein [Amycolatopsis cihanbeyliensis]TQJ01297.1 hypothetical protein FB471_0971 [Amycolatopsis cihanbeyliensis]